MRASTKRIRDIIKRADTAGGVWVRTWPDGEVWAGVKNKCDEQGFEELCNALDNAGVKHTPWPKPGTAGWLSTTITAME